MPRRKALRLIVIASFACAVAAGGLRVVVLAQEMTGSDARVIKVVAKKFVFTPHEFVLKKGQPVVFELTTQDFEHGFKVPDLDFRADFVPDRMTKARLTPQKTGKFELLCDNFCGSGHEEMDGTIVVEE